MHQFTYILSALFLPLVAMADETAPGSAEPPRETQLVYKGGKGHGHQGVTTNGKQWFVMHTDQIFRYESPDFSVDQSTLVRNMEPFSHPDFKGTCIDHLGAPECHDGKLYTFAKTYKAYQEGKCEYKVWLVWYSQDDLKYMGFVPIARSLSFVQRQSVLCGVQGASGLSILILLVAEKVVGTRRVP